MANPKAEKDTNAIAVLLILLLTSAQTAKIFINIVTEFLRVDVGNVEFRVSSI